MSFPTARSTDPNHRTFPSALVSLESHLGTVSHHSATVLKTDILQFSMAKGRSELVLGYLPGRISLLDIARSTGAVYVAPCVYTGMPNTWDRTVCKATRPCALVQENIQRLLSMGILWTQSIASAEFASNPQIWSHGAVTSRSGIFQLMTSVGTFEFHGGGDGGKSDTMSKQLCGGVMAGQPTLRIRQSTTKNTLLHWMTVIVTFRLD
jgi:hypothetical protein